MLKTFLSSTAAMLAATSLCAQNLPELNGDPANDTFGGAEIGAVGAQHYGNFVAGVDHDYWAITISNAPIQLNLWTSDRGTADEADDTILTLYAPDGTTVLATDDDGNDGFLSQLSYGIQTNGTYYVDVESWSSSVTGDYSLDVNASPIAVLDLCGGVIAPVAPDSELPGNDSCSTPDTIAPCTSRQERIQPGGDTDFFCFTLTGATSVVFETEIDSTMGIARTDTELWLYDSACVEIGNNDDGGPGLLSLLEADLNAGTYYLEVGSFNRGSTATGTYRVIFRAVTNLVAPGSGTAGSEVIVDLQPAPTSICGGSFPPIGVDNEPNSTPAQAQASNNIIVPCTDTIGTIGMVSAGVTDMWCFTVASTATITFETIEDSTLAGAYTDTKLWLYDSNGTEIASNDDGGAGLLSRLERVYAPGNYYIECHHWLRTATGTFRLRMDQLTTPMRCRGGLGGQSVLFNHRDGEKTQQNSPVSIDITGAAGPGVVFLSFGAGAVIGGGLELSLVGMPQCRLYVSPAVATPAYLPGVGSDFEYSYPVGGLPAGSQINIQAALIDFAAAIYRPFLPVTLSDQGVNWIVGDETFH